MTMVKKSVFRIVYISLCLVIIFMANANISFADRIKIKNWLCYYGNTFGPDMYSRFDLVVLDGTTHPPLPDKDDKHKPIVLGYVNVGEVDTKSPFWSFAKDKPYLVKKDDFWDSWIVDIRDPSWQQFLFEIAIPSVIEQGFDGLFLDTFDSSLSLLEGEDGEKFMGIEDALAKITMRIKAEYPEILVAINRGLPALPYFEEYIDFVVVEDLYSYYEDHDKGYIKVDDTSQKILLEQVSKGLRVNPDLVVLSLDYVSTEQMETAKNAISFSRKKGFIPYVSTYKLDQIFFYTLHN